MSARRQRIRASPRFSTGSSSLRCVSRSGGAGRPVGATDCHRRSALETSLYGAHEVGYLKDIVRWTTPAELMAAFEKRLTRILQESRRIGSIQEGREYFLEAARRKETVFVSYSGQDEAPVAPIVAALRRRFQAVFDYRDGGESIEPGRPWMDEIFTKLDRSAAAVLILSSGYWLQATARTKRGVSWRRGTRRSSRWCRSS